MNNIFEQVIKNIETLMAQREWKQVDLARKTGINPPSVSNYMSGKVRPTVDVLIRIADVLGVQVSTLFSQDLSASTALHKSYVMKETGSLRQTLDRLSRQLAWIDSVPPEALDILSKLPPEAWRVITPTLEGYSRLDWNHLTRSDGTGGHNVKAPAREVVELSSRKAKK
jgi:putative transcriptional regulator